MLYSFLFFLVAGVVLSDSTDFPPTEREMLTFDEKTTTHHSLPSGTGLSSFSFSRLVSDLVATVLLRETDLQHQQ